MTSDEIRREVEALIRSEASLRVKRVGVDDKGDRRLVGYAVACVGDAIGWLERILVERAIER